MTSSADYPKGGVLSDDLLLDPCPHCDCNRTGLFTERTANQNVSGLLCVKCGALFSAEGIVRRVSDGVDQVPMSKPLVRVEQ